MKIVSWNINSIQARITHLVDWLKEHQPDICLLQEIKCINETFPLMFLEELGYNIVTHGQKSYNGVAILSKTPIEEFTTKFLDDPNPEQSRYLEIVTSYKGKVLRVACVYVPNGQSLDSDKFEYKIKFLKSLKHHMKNILSYGEYFIIGGDFNIAPHNEDVYDPISLAETVCFSKEEKMLFREIENLGLIDSYRILYPNKTQYTWWDYRGGGYNYNKGMRIDYIFLSPEAASCLVDCQVDEEPRKKERPSDHAPIYCTLKF